jgi:hypothetical protein
MGGTWKQLLQTKAESSAPNTGREGQCRGTGGCPLLLSPSQLPQSRSGHPLAPLHSPAPRPKPGSSSTVVRVKGTGLEVISFSGFQEARVGSGDGAQGGETLWPPGISPSSLFSFLPRFLCPTGFWDFLSLNLLITHGPSSHARSLRKPYLISEVGKKAHLLLLSSLQARVIGGRRLAAPCTPCLLQKSLTLGSHQCRFRGCLSTRWIQDLYRARASAT